MATTMNSTERRTVFLGIVVSTVMVLPFCELSTKYYSLSFTTYIQVPLILFTISLAYITNRKTNLTLYKITAEKILMLGLIFSIFISILNSELPSTSIKRSIIISTSTITSFTIAIYTKTPRKFFTGFSIGIITITLASVIYGGFAAIVDFNFVNRQTYELVEFKLFGFELRQTIAHRAFMLDGATYYIQRYAGIFPNPNGLGLACSISFGLSYFLTERNKIKLPVQALCIFGLFLSLSRMGAILCLAIIAYYNVKNTYTRRILCAVTIVGLFSFLYTTAYSANTALDLNNQNNSFEFFQLRERAYLMTMAWHGFLENWTVGVGYGVGAEYLFPDNAKTLAVHSVFLNTALETGILGLTFLLAIWLFPIFATKADPRRDTCSNHARHVIASVLFGLFFAEAFDLSVMRFHYIHLIFFFLLGIWSALGRDSKDTALQDAQYSDTPNTLTTQLESSERPDR